MSFGGERDDTEEAALLYAEQAGVVAVAAAGNCGHADADNLKLNHCKSRNDLVYPAGYDTTVISVANYTKRHDRDDGSTANGSVDVAAPGAKILSTCLAGEYRCTNVPHCKQWLPPNLRHDCTEEMPERQQADLRGIRYLDGHALRGRDGSVAAGASSGRVAGGGPRGDRALDPGGARASRRACILTSSVPGYSIRSPRRPIWISTRAARCRVRADPAGRAAPSGRTRSWRAMSAPTTRCS